MGKARKYYWDCANLDAFALRAQAISALLNTRFMFRQPDPEVAAWSARNLGETTLEEVREGISYGANTMRDGVSINRIERDKPVVSYSDIMRLDNLSCFLRLPGNYPITEIQFDYRKPLKHNEPFVPRAMEQDDLRNQVLELTEDLTKNMPKNMPKNTKQETPEGSPPKENIFDIAKPIPTEKFAHATRSIKKRILD